MLRRSLPSVSLASLPLGALVLAAACQDAGTGPTPAAPVASRAGAEAPVMQADQQAGIIPGQYIVVYKDDVADVAGVTRAVAGAADADVRFVYDKVIKGFSAAMSEEDAAAVAQDPRVAYVVPNGIATITGTQTPLVSGHWGLNRIDQRALPLDQSYNYSDSRNVVHAYILDTGILTGHVDFAGPNNTRRTGPGFDAVTIGGNAEDCNGHGTHVAGTVGGTTHGVAKNTILYPVRVLSCGGSGTWDGVIAGMNWVAANHIKPAVANMSLGGGTNAAVNQAATNLVAAGVTTVVAAGNSNGADACNFSPAGAQNVITVGSTTNTDARSGFSNIGTCVEIFAPGSGVLSAWWTSPTATSTISGTSMASPHVAGVVAQYLARRGNVAPANVLSWIEANATQNAVTNPGTGSPNLLLFSPF